MNRVLQFSLPMLLTAAIVAICYAATTTTLLGNLDMMEFLFADPWKVFLSLAGCFIPAPQHSLGETFWQHMAAHAWGNRCRERDEDLKLAVSCPVKTRDRHLRLVSINGEVSTSAPAPFESQPPTGPAKQGIRTDFLHGFALAGMAFHVSPEALEVHLEPQQTLDPQTASEPSR